MYSYRRPIKAKPLDVIASARVRLGAVISDAERLTVSRHDPESFHIQKNEIVTNLRQLERDLAQAK